MQSVIDICSGLPERQFSAGEEVLSENGDCGCLFILKAGSVEILKGELQVNVVSSPGSVFGEVSVLLGRPHMATVKALEASTFYLVEGGRGFLEGNPDINFHIARLLAQRLNSVTNYLADLQQQFNAREDHIGMVDEVLEGILNHQARLGGEAGSAPPSSR